MDNIESETALCQVVRDATDPSSHHRRWIQVSSKDTIEAVQQNAGLGLRSETHRSSPVSEFCNMINMSSRKDARSSYHPLLVSHPLECKNIPMQCFEHSRHGQRFDTGQRITKGICGSLWSVSEADGQASPTKVVAGPSDFFEFVLDIVECPAQTLSIRRKVSAGS